MDILTARTLSIAAFAVIAAIFYASMTWGTFFAKKRKPPGNEGEADEEL
jgi:hypothetical protein